ncbi:ATP-dependent Clp protease adaptor ClpS [Tahibacter amnicola]|uniref:ATP-dependent Clp protease adaptor ClpS n=1 Tax=Tahibacter amnicola TaxID=2976241 RepID=A0ABY6BMP1_9GAMM|nr:ATP-dependent Clp protease adaptor ClpS [Tahibacter amnicola]UXI70325.1 ATP-dependent Clp protease adaptor ClpS [Tahibacter amnicola]
MRNSFWQRFLDELRAAWKGPPPPIIDRDSVSLALKSTLKEDFCYGVELLDDDKTPMDFVADALQRHARMDSRDAQFVTVHIHAHGGILLSTATLEDAQAVARGITDDATRHGFPLVCRVVHRKTPPGDA